MIDYAREASIELHNAFYELDDIIYYDFTAAMEAPLASTNSSDASTEPASSGTATQSSANAAKDDNDDARKRAEETKARLKAKQEAKKAGEENNKDLKNTTGFVAKLKAIVQKIVDLVKSAIGKLAEKIDKMQDKFHEKYLEKLRDAKSKNGFKAVEIENYRYKTKPFDDFSNAVIAYVNNTQSKLDGMFRAYSNSNGLEDSEKENLKKVNERENESYEYLALKGSLPTQKGATPDTILTEFQELVRGKKEKFKVDEGAANACESIIVNMRNNIKSITRVCNSAKDLAKKISDNTKSITQNPSTDAESNELITKRVNNLGKLASFLVNASTLMANLHNEMVTNSKIVLQRVYNFNALGVKAAKKGEEESSDTSDDKELDESTNELNNTNVGE